MSIADGKLAICIGCEAKVEVENNVFANFLLGTTIQDDGTRERSNEYFYMLKLKTIDFVFFKSTIYYTGCNGSSCLQEELCMEYQYPNLLYSYPTQRTTKELNLLLWQPLDQCPIEAQTINLTVGISSREHKLCNSQENSTGNYNSILLTIYIN